MENFQSLGLPEVLLKSLKDMGFITPTPIQAQAIPVALEGRDILGSAQTGTGKTGAYLIPLVANMLANKASGALVLTPTRELATQVIDALKQLLGKGSEIKTALLIGGEPMFKQLNQLKNNPKIIVGTPGRINDHLARRSLSLAKTNFVVFDETDRMLDLGFSVQLKEIAKYLPQERQMLMFSATMAQEILKLAYSYLKDSVRITVGSTTSPVKSVTQEVIKTSESEKYGILLGQLEERSGSHIVFVKTKSGADRLAGKLRNQGHASESLHGDLRQRNRDKIIKEFRDYKHRILVATDVAARGLDIPHLQCVVNYDLPQCPEDYIHRVGRVGRAGAEGVAVNLLTAQDGAKWKAICKLIDPNSVQEEIAVGSSSNRNKSSARRGTSGGFGRSQKPAFGRSSGDGERSSSGGFGRSQKPAFGRSSGDGERSSSGGFGRSQKPAFGRSSGDGERSSGGFGRSQKPAFGKSSERSEGTAGAFRTAKKPFDRSSGDGERSSSGGFGRSQKPAFGRSSGDGERSSGGFGRSQKPAFGKSSERSEGTAGAFRTAKKPFDRSSGDGERSSGGFGRSQKPAFGKSSERSEGTDGGFKPKSESFKKSFKSSGDVGGESKFKKPGFAKPFKQAAKGNFKRGK